MALKIFCAIASAVTSFLTMADFKEGEYPEISVSTLLKRGSGVISGEAFSETSPPCTGDSPLDVPLCPFFKFEWSTLWVKSERVDLIMNSLKKLLLTTPPTAIGYTDITKINPRKCCLKARVFVDNLDCVFKAKCYGTQDSKPRFRFLFFCSRKKGRAYRTNWNAQACSLQLLQETGVLALEIQKRCGDSVIYPNIFRFIAKALSNHFDVIKGMPPHPAEPFFGVLPDANTDVDADENDTAETLVEERPPLYATALCPN